MTSGRTSTTASNDDVALVLAGGDVELGLGDHVDVVLAQRLDVVLGQRVLERLGPRVHRVDAGLEHLAGHLARPGTRDADLAGDSSRPASTLGLELVGLDGDGDLDLVALEGLDGGFHRLRQSTGGL